MTCPGQANFASYWSHGQAGIQVFFKPWLVIDSSVFDVITGVKQMRVSFVV